MGSFRVFAVPAAVLTFGAVAPAQAGVHFNGLTMNSLTVNSLIYNALSTNALTDNSLSTNALAGNSLSANALATTGSALDQLNGVAVEAIALPPAHQR
jgi:hypothetical protein